jgi:biofilm PGA synthesis lipoprotein PgaB
MPAINFIVTSRCENSSPSNDDLNPLTQDQIRQMYKSGLVDIGSHSNDSHRYILRNEKAETGGALAYHEYNKDTKTYETDESYNRRVTDDLTKSADIIQRYTDTRSNVLCFPFGQYNQRLIDLSRSAGFKYFVTTAYGYNSENSRKSIILRIRSGDSKLNTDTLKQNIIQCGQGKKPAPVNKNKK